MDSREIEGEGEEERPRWRRSITIVRALWTDQGQTKQDPRVVCDQGGRGEDEREEERPEGRWREDHHTTWRKSEREGRERIAIHTMACDWPR